MKCIFWFRRDLRLSDNYGLYCALKENHEVLPVFIIRPEMYKSSDTGISRLAFIFDGIRELDWQIKKYFSKLIIREGNPADELLKVSLETGITSLYYNKTYNPEEVASDRNITALLEAKGFEVKPFKDSVIFEEKELVSAYGRPVKSFRNYRAAWLNRLAPEDYREFKITEKLKGNFARKDSFIASLSCPEPEDYNLNCEGAYPRGGEKQARKVFNDFFALKTEPLKANQKQPAVTSRLSPYLAFGNISVRKCVKAIITKSYDPDNRQFYEKWLEKLIMRDYYYQMAFNFPEEVRVNNTENNREWNIKYQHFLSWCQGTTGFPLIDAAMRELNGKAWINYELRKLTANFLISTLRVDWQWGERYFMHKLVDGDQAINICEWKNIAAHKDRNFDPVEAGKKIDKQGLYIKKYVPQLRNVPEIYIHEPFKMPKSLQEKLSCLIGTHYPYPVVESRAMEKNIIRINNTLSE